MRVLGWFYHSIRTLMVIDLFEVPVYVINRLCYQPVSDV